MLRLSLFLVVAKICASLTLSLRNFRRATGLPTTFLPVGCKQIHKADPDLESVALQNNSIGQCFTHCAPQVGRNQYFAVSGEKCWCGNLLHFAATVEDLSVLCHTPCPGAPPEKCGGTDFQDEFVWSVFVTAECLTTPDAKRSYDSEKLGYKAARDASILKSYRKMDGRTCGQETELEVDGSSTLVGGEDDCKRACWGTAECGGFTYSRDTSKCTFYLDTSKGDVDEDKYSACYVKEVFQGTGEAYRAVATAAVERGLRAQSSQ